jgi:outer membrane protein OmpA-like peptidoglycan-associated protein
MNETVVKIAFLSLCICNTQLLAAEEPYYSQTEEEWCKILNLDPSCSDPANQGIEDKGIEDKGLIERSTVRVQFYPNSATIAKSDPALDSLGRALRTFPATIIVEGHTDSIGSNAYNLRLSKKRAQTIRNYLIEKYGIASNKLKAIGYGESIPLADNSSALGRSKNRRVQFKKQQ